MAERLHTPRVDARRTKPKQLQPAEEEIAPEFVGPEGFQTIKCGAGVADSASSVQPKCRRPRSGNRPEWSTDIGPSLFSDGSPTGTCPSATLRPTSRSAGRPPWSSDTSTPVGQDAALAGEVGVASTPSPRPRRPPRVGMERPAWNADVGKPNVKADDPVGDATYIPSSRTRRPLAKTCLEHPPWNSDVGGSFASDSAPAGDSSNKLASQRRRPPSKTRSERPPWNSDVGGSCVSEGAPADDASDNPTGLRRAPASALKDAALQRPCSGGVANAERMLPSVDTSLKAVDTSSSPFSGDDDSVGRQNESGNPSPTRGASLPLAQNHRRSGDAEGSGGCVDSVRDEFPSNDGKSNVAASLLAASSPMLSADDIPASGDGRSAFDAAMAKKNESRKVVGSVAAADATPAAPSRKRDQPPEHAKAMAEKNEIRNVAGGFVAADATPATPSRKGDQRFDHAKEIRNVAGGFVAADETPATPSRKGDQHFDHAKIPSAAEEILASGVGRSPFDVMAFEGALAEAAEDTEPQEQCAHCGRSFRLKALQRHQKICEKVFLQKRKAFDVVATVIPAEAAKAKKANEVLARKTAGRNVNGPVADSGSWREKSEAMRAGMRAARVVSKFIKEGRPLSELPPPKPTPVELDDRVPCPHCGRRFGTQQAERHIPHCAKQKLKRR
eukprot:TRINITY_DN34772_c0_g1_i1.p1 TRINITY_DN34772_c0_g1~~TRINITY_DN34772_c0_g1_i1.p1  ORF type:complete len:700 (-),score=134.71 TRINITY_DN34772_c0_g1_i1:62-2074(-)